MRNVLIVGGTRGIGRALVDEYVAAGDRVWATVRAPVEIPGATVIAGVDTADDVSCVDLLDRLRERDVTHLDVVIISAGILKREYLPDLIGEGRAAAFARIQEQFEVNALGPLRVATAIQGLLGRGSKLAVISSRRGAVGDNTTGGSYGYRMSKAAVNMAFVNLARDLAPRGIIVAVLHPGFVQTELTGGKGDVTPEIAARGLVARIDEATIETSGQAFHHANGEILPW